MGCNLSYTVGVAALALSFTIAAAPKTEAKIYRYNCSYTQTASPEGVKSTSTFKLEFAFDDMTGKAVLIGNIGMADVEIYVGNWGVTFLEKIATGTVQTTTIANGGNSVHSRHSLAGVTKWCQANITVSVPPNRLLAIVGWGVWAFF